VTYDWVNGHTEVKRPGGTKCLGDGWSNERLWTDATKAPFIATQLNSTRLPTTLRRRFWTSERSWPSL